mmetsp:Transcript_5448/g.8573  ORF Transcript_5448/g.8573 Transcript_5448/m.8573 type:complete len:649 (+) Transcript_5448:119-2065(+)
MVTKSGEEAAKAREKWEELNRKEDKELEERLVSYRAENEDVQRFRYKQPNVKLPENASEIKIEEPAPIDECREKKNTLVPCAPFSKLYRCVNCEETYCSYHVEPNTGGIVGGHTCKGTIACSSTFHLFCDREKREICKGCGLSYCNYHFEENNELSGKTGGHFCTKGCSTSLIFTPNCKGDTEECPKCYVKYCDHHLPTADKITQLRAGHVCYDVTGGAVLFGDSFGDFFSLAGQVVIAFASGGTCNMAAITLLFRSMKIAALTMIDKYGLQDMKPFAMKVVNWVLSQAGLKEGELIEKDRTGRSIMFKEDFVSKENIALFCGATQTAGKAIEAINKLHKETVPKWLEMAVETANKIGHSVEIYQNLVVNAIKASFMITEILGLIHHFEAARAGNLGEVIKVVKSAANVIDDFNILFGFTKKEYVDEKNNANKNSIDLHRHLAIKHSKAHAERSLQPMSDTDRHIIRYARKNNHGQGDPFIESLMAFDSQINLVQNQKKEIAQAHEDEIRRLTDHIRELEASQRYLPTPEQYDSAPKIRRGNGNRQEEQDQTSSLAGRNHRSNSSPYYESDAPRGDFEDKYQRVKALEDQVENMGMILARVEQSMEAHTIRSRGRFTRFQTEMMDTQTRNVSRRPWSRSVDPNETHYI